MKLKLQRNTQKKQCFVLNMPQNAFKYIRNDQIQNETSVANNREQQTFNVGGCEENDMVEKDTIRIYIEKNEFNLRALVGRCIG